MIRFNSKHIAFYSGVWLIFCFLCPANADEYSKWHIRGFTAPDDLPNEVVRDAIMTRDGAVWLASWGGGVVVFTRNQKRVVDVDSGLISNDVRVLEEDKEGRIWVGTANGISCINGNEIHNFSPDNMSDIPGDGSIYAIECMENGEIWFGDGLSNLFAWIPSTKDDDVQKGTWNFIHRFSGENGTGIRQIKQFDNHKIWLVVNKVGLVQIQLSGAYEINPWNDKYNEIAWKSRDVVCLPSNRIICTGDRTLYELIGTTIHPIYESPLFITCIEYAFGALFFGTEQGLYILNDKQEIFFPLTDDRSKNYIESLSYFEDGSLWVGTRNGVYRVARLPWIAQCPPQTKSSLVGESILSNEKKQIFCIDGDRTLWTFSENDWSSLCQIEPFKDVDGDFDVFNSYYQSETLFLCNRHRLIEFDLSQKRVMKEIHFPGDIPVGKHNPLFKPNEHEVWYTSADGILRWEHERFEPVFNLSHHDDPSVCTILETVPGEYWFGGKGWIDRWKDGRFIDVNIPDSFLVDRNKVITSLKTREGELWFSMLGNGVLRFKDGKWFHHTIKTGLISNYIRSLFQSGDGTIWAGDRNHGIMSFKDTRWIRYDSDDGVPVGEVVSIAEDGQQRIWLGIINQGVYAFNQDHLAPAVDIVSAPDRLVPDARGVFSYRGYDAWNHTQRDKLVYSWRIIGKDDGESIIDWNPYSYDNSALLPPLKPGRYIFEVRAQDTNRNTSEKSARSEFTVIPYFWMTYFFQIPSAFAIFFAGITIYFFFNRYKKVLISEKKFKSLVEQDAYTLITFWNERGLLTYANECAQKMLGIQDEELATRSVRDSLFSCDRDSLDSFDRTMKELMSGKSLHTTVTLPTRGKNGSVLWITWLFRIRYEDDGDSFEIHSFGTDITSKKRMEEEKMAIEEELNYEKIGFQRFCDKTQIGVIRLSKSNKIIYVNSAMAKIAGFSSVYSMMRHPNPFQWEREYLFGQFLTGLKPNSENSPVVLKGKKNNGIEDYFVMLYGVVKKDEINIIALDLTKEKKLEKEIVSTSTNALKRIGQDLHDTILQELTGITYLAQIVMHGVKNNKQCEFDEIKMIVDMLNDASRKARIISKGASPFTLGNLGFHAALQELTASIQNIYSIPCEYTANYDVHINNEEVELQLYYIAHEAVTNAAKHGKPTRVQLTLEQISDNLTLSISDDGIGISEKELNDGMGIQIMKLRASVIMADINIKRRLEGGTLVECRYPFIKYQ